MPAFQGGLDDHYPQRQLPDDNYPIIETKNDHATTHEPHSEELPRGRRESASTHGPDLQE